MNDFLGFRRFITPMIIQIIFWLGVIVAVISALGIMFRGGAAGLLSGLLALIIGPILVRVYCELLILFFRIYEELVAIRTGRPPGDAQGFPVMPASPSGAPPMQPMQPIV